MEFELVDRLVLGNESLDLECAIFQSYEHMSMRISPESNPRENRTTACADFTVHLAGR